MKKEFKDNLSWSFVNATGVFLYVFLVAWIMSNGERIFGQMKSLAGPATFLLLFVLSAAITGSLVIGRPVWYYLDGKKKDALKLLAMTIGWLFFLVVMMLGLLATK